MHIAGMESSKERAKKIFFYDDELSSIARSYPQVSILHLIPCDVTVTL
jgi:hypothetical protein